MLHVEENLSLQGASLKFLTLIENPIHSKAREQKKIVNSEEQKQRSIADGTEKQAEWRILGTREAIMMTQWKKRQ